MDQVTNLKYSVTGTNSVLISWDTVPDATEYQIEFRQKNVTLATQVVAVPEVPLTGIVVGELYEVLVVATDGSTTSERSRLVVYLSVNDWLPRVTDLAYSELESRDGMTVTWGASPGATSYRLICETYGAESQTVFDGAATSPHVLTGLVEETLYRITVIPVNEDVEGIAATTIGWIAPIVDSSRNKKTSHLLFPAEVQADFRLLYRPYIQNMRQLREEPDYWRIIDTVATTEGAEDIGTALDIKLHPWEAQTKPEGIEVKRQDTDNPKIYQYPTVGEPLAVSLGFDQLGSILLAYETSAGAFLYAYDSQTKQYVTHEFPGLITPVIAYTSYLQPLPTNASERLLVLADTANNAIVYLRQSERFTTQHSFSVGSGRLLEILSAGRSVMGGFTISAAIQVGDQVVVRSFTAPDTLGHVYGDVCFLEKLEISYGAASQVFAGVETLSYVQVFPDTLQLEKTITGSVDLLELTEKARFTVITNSNQNEQGTVQGLLPLSVDITSIQFTISGAIDVLDLTEKARFTSLGTDNTSINSVATLSVDNTPLTFTTTGGIQELSLTEKAQFINAGNFSDNVSNIFHTSGSVDELTLTQVV